eukprot:PhM_4_TR11672/c1_g1_i10/m.86623
MAFVHCSARHLVSVFLAFIIIYVVTISQLVRSHDDDGQTGVRVGAVSQETKTTAAPTISSMASSSTGSDQFVANGLRPKTVHKANRRRHSNALYRTFEEDAQPKSAIGKARNFINKSETTTNNKKRAADYVMSLRRSLASGGLIPINTSKKGWRESYERDLDVLRGHEQQPRRTPWELVEEDPVLYHRDEARLSKRQRQVRSGASTASFPNVACVYTGFVRDFARMAEDCAVGCDSHEIRKLWGGHLSRVWLLNRCDIFMTTWHMHGVGGYQRLFFDPVTSPDVDLVRLADIMRPFLAVLHVQNYTLYDAVFKNMSRARRSFSEYRRRKGVAHKPYMRFNDISQAYKLYVAWHLVASVSSPYDVIMRLRPDVRTHRSLSMQWASATIVPAKGRDVQMRIFGDEGRPYVVTLNGTTLYSGDLYPSDFAFVAFPTVMECVMTRIWLDQCNGAIESSNSISNTSDSSTNHNNGTLTYRTQWRYPDIPEAQLTSIRSHDSRVTMNYVLWHSYRSCAERVRDDVPFTRISRRAGYTLDSLRAGKKRAKKPSKR